MKDIGVQQSTLYDLRFRELITILVMHDQVLHMKCKIADGKHGNHFKVRNVFVDERDEPLMIGLIQIASGSAGIPWRSGRKIAKALCKKTGTRKSTIITHPISK
jgi:hypothetical protein